DLSGIQSFIYDIASSKAAKSLKGRSFYLQLLAEAMLDKFKNNSEIRAKSAHVLYASGGKFYLLLPNTRKVKLAIDVIKKEVERELWDLHKGKLSINLACVPFAYRNNYAKKEHWLEIEDFKQERKQLKDLWKLLADKITKQKEQKFKSLLENNFIEFFDEKNPKLTVGGNVEICAVTGEELNENNSVVYNEEDVKKDSNVERKYTTKEVLEQTELGKKLKDADFILSSNKNLIEKNTFLDKKSTSIKILDTNFYLFDEKEIEKETRKITSADFCHIQYINDTDFLQKHIDGLNVSYGFQFYGGNKQADFSKIIEENGKTKILKGKEKTFQDLAKTDNGENSLLGILRMDIDNLGKIFIEGFKKFDDQPNTKDRMSFSAFSTLSFHLDLFFSGYLNDLRDNYIEKDENGNDKFDEHKYPVYQFKDWLNILYSGGDDLFVVGRWDKTIEFAELVRKEFAEYSQRKEIGISGGISFVHEKFPIAKAADLAGEAESASKKYPKEKPFDDKDKNALTFFGETINWETEFKTVKTYKEQFIKYISENNLSKGILHKLMLFANMKKENEKNLEKGKKEKLDYSYIWNTAYYLKRFAERFKFDKDSQKEKDLKNKEVYEFIMGNKEKG
ncbi:MAG: type III-A CRISPR-associated protein Cas10/Csm1, partial [Bacteroidales bacterium]|nr:type III-A CRISPR-associated protein Cas10/Csm1 [Bacteroidales bacterium]